MSKRETPYTEKYWQEIGGILIPEFPLVTGPGTNGIRRADGLIILGGEKKKLNKYDGDLSGEDVVIVQTKANKLGMGVIGQAIISRHLIERHYKPKSIRSVIVCTGDCEILRREIHRFEFLDVKIYPIDLLGQV